MESKINFLSLKGKRGMADMNNILKVVIGFIIAIIGAVLMIYLGAYLLPVFQTACALIQATGVPLADLFDPNGFMPLIFLVVVLIIVIVLLFSVLAKAGKGK